jgi:hypothetical protein
LFFPFRPPHAEVLVLLAIAGIFLILGLLGFTAFLAGKEHLKAMQRDEDILSRALPRTHWH